jgi:hypothetical protein
MIDPMHTSALPFDRREDQATRAADFMELHPEGVTTADIIRECDPGSVTKLLSDMRLKYGYVIRKVQGREVCASGTEQRRRPRFILVSRPSQAQQNLFPPT